MMKKVNSKVYIKLIDLLVLIFSTFVTNIIRFNTIDLTNIYAFLLIASFIIFFLLSFVIWNSTPNSYLANIQQVIKCWVYTIFILTLILFFFQFSTVFSRIWYFIWISLTLVALITFRSVSYSYFNNKVKTSDQNRIIIIGIIKETKNFLKVIKGDNIDIKQTLSPEELEDTNKLKFRNTDELWILSTGLNSKRIEEIISRLKNTTVTIRLIPNMVMSRMRNLKVTEVYNIPMINLSSTELEGMNLYVKYFEDIIISTFILILISPLMILISIIIKVTSPGPIIYKQLRHGLRGSEIKVYKFRTMKHYKNEYNFLQANEEIFRITSFGKFLRRTSLDELPQFINVLQGRMSIVGPRPHATDHSNEINSMMKNYMWRHKVKPGITGLAQINGYRGPINNIEHMERRIEYDLYYISNWSIYLDLLIIFLSIYKGFISKS